MTQLPKNIYEIIRQYEHIPNVTAKSTDELIYNISKAYFYSVIESLSKLIRSIQQGQRTSLVSMARVINEQKEIIKEYQGLTELPNQIKRGQGQLQKEIDRVKEQTAAQLGRVDKRAIATYAIISDIKSQIKKIENTLENTGILVEQSEQLEWEFPEDIVELHAADENEFFHTDDEVPPLESEETNVQTHQLQNIQNQEEGEIPNRLSPIMNYIPAGGEEEETASSQETVLELETTVQDGIADFFYTPSYRSTDPSLRQTVETKEDWGDTPSVELSIQSLHCNQDRIQDLKKDSDTSEEEEREEDRIGEKEIKIIIIVITFINSYSICPRSKEIKIRTKLRRVNLNQTKL